MISSQRVQSSELTSKVKTSTRKLEMYRMDTGIQSLNKGVTSSDDEDLFSQEKANRSEFSTSTKYHEHLAEKRVAMREARKK